MGKSTLWDAVTWVCYGRTSTGSRASSIRSWGKPIPCRGKVKLTIDRVEWVVKRTQAPNVLKVYNGTVWEVVDQDRIDQLLGMTYEQFLHAVLISQFGKWFVELAPTAKTELLSEILQLEKWDSYSDRAKQQLVIVDEVLQSLALEKERVRGQLQQLDLTVVTEQVNQWDKDQRKRVATLQTDISTRGEELRAARKQNEGPVETLQKRLRLLQKKLEKLTVKVVKLRERQAQNHSRSVTLQEQYLALETVTAVCPTCGQTVSTKHLRAEKHRVEVEQHQLDTKKQQQVIRLKKLEARSFKISMRRDTVQSQIEDETQSRQNRIQQLQTDIEVKQNELGVVRAQDNPHRDLLHRAKKQRQVLQGQLTTLTTTRQKKTRRKLRYEFWSREFKLVKLYILDQVLKHLELEVNEALEHLGLLGWTIKVSTDRATKSGTIQKKLHFFIYSPTHRKARTIEEFSGGERQRLRIAVQLGLANLILARKGVQVNVQVFDEPTAWLSATGVEDLLTTLQQWAEDQRRTVWLLDHRSISFGGFAARYSVQFDENGSLFEPLNR